MSSYFQGTLDVMLTIEFYFEWISNKRVKLNILDVGCGFGKYGSLIKHVSLERKLCPYIIGIDVWLPYLRALNGINAYDALLSCEAGNLPFSNRIFDLVIATEIIEHMEKRNGILFLKSLEKLAKKGGLIIVSTPQGKQEQETSEGNTYQIHKSVWMKYELECLGFSVFTSPLVIRTPFGNRFLPKRCFPEKGSDNLKNMLLFSLSAFSFLVPSFSGKLVAYKLVNE